MNIRKATIEDLDGIFTLYKVVASIEGGLARKADEITSEYISSFVQKSISLGCILVASDEQNFIFGEIHCYSPNIKVFSHVLNELTIAVHPNYQGKGIGRVLFEQLLSDVKSNKLEILRIELIARESNTKAIAFYESLGFIKEGRFEKRIQSVGGGFEADIPMAWMRK